MPNAPDASARECSVGCPACIGPVPDSEHPPKRRNASAPLPFWPCLAHERTPVRSFADQLRRLRKDAGIASVPPAAPIDRSSINALRQPMRLREGRRLPALTVPAGDEVAPGVRYVERSLAYAAESTLQVPSIADAPLERPPAPQPH